MIDQLPEKIGKYEVIDVLGKGSMGIVYRGHDSYVDRPVAIKLATNADTDTDGQNMAKRMFVNEARAAGRLDHPNILKVYEAGEENEQPYMVMEYIEGGDTLRTYCNKENLLPIREVVRMIRDTARALAHAHEEGVLHRDIKPANIMLTRNGIVKLGDFGIARRMGVDQTQIVGWFGSPLYMSPEQARDSDITTQSDLFSLGSVLYEMIAGVPPFAAKGLTGLIQKVCHEDPTPLTEVREEVPEVLQRIAQKMLEKEVTKRYKTGDEIANDLENALEALEHESLALSDDEKLERMRELKFFDGFSKPELKEVAKASNWRRFAEGDTLFGQGDKVPGFYVIVDGLVGTAINGVRIGEHETGDCFGEMAYLSGAGRIASAVAQRDTTIIYVERDFREWASLPCQLRLNRAFQTALIERLKSTSQALARALG